MDNGVVYQLTGLRDCELLCVSLWSLRQYYDGPITIVHVTETTVPASVMAKYFKCDLKLGFVPSHASQPHSTAKTTTYLVSPYITTVYLDADTLIMGPIDDLFLVGGGVALIGMSDLRVKSDHPASKMLVRKLRKWANTAGPVGDVMFERMMIVDQPLFNLGVFIFRRQHAFLWQLHLIATAAKYYPIGDERLAQLIAPLHDDARILGDKWNRLVQFGSFDDATILHFTNRRHYYGGKKSTRLWQSHCDQAIMEGAADLDKWAGTYDKYVRRMRLEGKILNEGGTYSEAPISGENEKLSTGAVTPSG